MRGCEFLEHVRRTDPDWQWSSADFEAWEAEHGEYTGSAWEAAAVKAAGDLLNSHPSWQADHDFTPAAKKAATLALARHMTITGHVSVSPGLSSSFEGVTSKATPAKAYTLSSPVLEVVQLREAPLR